MGKFSFPKAERLTKRNTIQELFSKGSSFYLYPFKVMVLFTTGDDTPPHQVLFSVSKRNFKRAVDRNLIKRRIREAYRLNKHLLPQSLKFKIAYIYIAKEIIDYQQLEEKLIEVNKRLHQYVEEN